MEQPIFSGYIGSFKQPIPELGTCIPTMYIVSDPLKYELDLILLTPVSYTHLRAHET